MQTAATATDKTRKRKGNLTKTDAQSSLQFVNANPRSESERRHVRALVRANASNFHWRQAKKADARSTAARSLMQRTQSAGTSSQSSAAVPAAHQTVDLPSQLEESSAVNVDDNQAHSGAIVPVRRRPNSGIIVNAHLPVSVGSPLQFVRVGHVDPFVLYPTELPKQVVNPALAQVIQFLPQIFLPEKRSLQSSVANAWARKCVSQRGLFHAFLFCQFARTRAIKGNQARRDIPELLMRCHSETVREIHNKFQNTSTACDDDNILAVLALAYNGEVLTEAPLKSPCQGPLTALQALDIYGGRLDTVAVHAEGLAKMLSIRRGLAEIKLPGLAQQISYGDIITASRKLTKPLLPYVSINSDVEGALNAVRRHSHPLCNLGEGFAVLNRILPPEKVAHLLPVLCKLRDYTLAVDDYVEGRPEAQDLGIIAEERNLTQHSLLSLTPNENAAAVEQECPLYELCRLAAIIYSLSIVFPLPVTTAPFAELGLQAKKQMSKPAVHARWTEAPQLMFWITVMAAIASVGSSERSWYISILDRLTGRLKMGSWAEMKECLQDFLWFGSINDVDGLDLWREIEYSSPFSL